MYHYQYISWKLQYEKSSFQFPTTEFKIRKLHNFKLTSAKEIVVHSTFYAEEYHV